MVKRLRKYLADNYSQHADYYLALGISIYPEDAITSEELIEQAEKSEFCLYNENKSVIG
ncbi:MAG: hypothetical protein MZU95_04345 [Desulfomicrobium escambiense]|nr:hypothetical protein [Desulfomicrobium escambiense]